MYSFKYQMKKMKIPRPTLDEELRFLHLGYDLVAGLDEVGRGAFAGPIVAASVILPFNFSALHELNDSKLLSKKKRQYLSELIKEKAVCFSIAEIPVSYINKYGIGKANQLALFKATQLLSKNMNQEKKTYYLIDGFTIKKINKFRQKAIIHGDRLSASIAAASIIAKVYRDTYMEKLSQKYQNYSFYLHKGYGTKLHRMAIQKYGLSDMHRTSFKLSKYLS